MQTVDQTLVACCDEKGLLPGQYTLTDATIRLYSGRGKDIRQIFKVTVLNPQLSVVSESGVGDHWKLNGRGYKVENLWIDFQEWSCECDRMECINKGRTVYFFLGKGYYHYRIAIHGLPIL